jgi:hypothetical protein
MFMISCMSQAITISSVGVLFATTIPAPCMPSHLTIGVPLTHFAFTVETSAIPGITGCYQVESIQLFIPFLFLFALELGVSRASRIHIRARAFTLAFFRTLHPNAYKRHTDLADDQRASVYLPADA